MVPVSCPVAFNGDISDYCTRISVSLGLSLFIEHYSVKQHKDLLLCKLIILENVLNNNTSSNLPLNAILLEASRKFRFAIGGYELYSTTKH